MLAAHVAKLRRLLPRLGAHGFVESGRVPPIDERNVSVVLAFFENCRPAMSRGTSSYSLKHRVERWFGGDLGNGAVIAALILCGFALGRVGPNAELRDPVNPEVDGFDVIRPSEASDSIKRLATR